MLRRVSLLFSCVWVVGCLQLDISLLVQHFADFNALHLHHYHQTLSQSSSSSSLSLSSTSLPLSDVTDVTNAFLSIKKSIATELSWWSYIFSGDSDSSNAAAYKPPRLPLSPLLQVEPEDLREYAREVKVVLGDTVDVLKEGILPENNEDLVAIFSSETCAGALGGISSQVMSILLNDEKKTSFFTETITDASFFGTRSIVRAISTILGLPQPVVNVAAPIIATLASESAKVEATRREQDKGKDDNTDNDDEEEDLEEREQVISYTPFNQSVHSIGQKVFDRKSWLRREIAISRGQYMTHGGHSPSGIDGNDRDCFGMIVDIAYYGSSGHVKSVLCQWKGNTSYKADVDNKAWMKPSDVWVVQDIVVKSNQQNEETFRVKNDSVDTTYTLSSRDERGGEEAYTAMDKVISKTSVLTAILTSTANTTVTTSKEKSKSIISLPEIAQDVAKWVSYNTLLPFDQRMNYAVVADYGLLAGMVGCLLYEVTSHNEEGKVDLNKSNDRAHRDIQPRGAEYDGIWSISKEEIYSIVSRFVKAGLEGAALFVAYEGSLQLLDINSDIRQMLRDKTKKIPFIPYSD